MGMSAIVDSNMRGDTGPMSNAPIFEVIMTEAAAAKRPRFVRGTRTLMRDGTEVTEDAWFECFWFGAKLGVVRLISSDVVDEVRKRERTQDG